MVADADAAIRNRDVYGAIVLGADGPALHLASGASPTVAALLTQATATLGQGRPVPVVDVVPTDPDDPRGAGFGAGFLPLAMTGLLAGILTFLLVRRRPARLAVSGTVAGLAAVLDRAGLALGAVTVFLVGNALSGVSSAAELLPQPWGAVGQFLPIGAGSTLLRSVAYFDGHGAAPAVWVLSAYAIGGLLLVAAGRRGLARPTDQVAPGASGQEREPVLVG